MKELRIPDEKALTKVIRIDAGGGTKPVTYADAIALTDRFIAQGRTRLAGLVVRQLLELFPNDAPPKAQQLQLNVNVRNHARALKIADEILPHLMDNSMVVGLCMRAYRQAGKIETAGHLADAARDSFPDDDVIQNEIGLCFIGRGERADAIKAFNRAIAINPRFIPPYLGRARFCAGKLAEEDIDAMVNLAEDVDLPDEDRAMLNFALAWAYEGIDTDKHFEYLRLANDAIARNRPWDEEADRRQVKEIKAFFGPELMRATRPWRIEQVAPIFIAGVPRSGTSLIEQILSSHDMVTGCGETGALQKAINETGIKSGTGTPIWNWPDSGNLGRHFCEIDRNYRKWLGAFEIDTPFFTDKSIGSDRGIGLILMMYPNARIVHCLRHPLDTCLSMYQLHFSSGQEFTYNLRWIAEYIQLHTEIMDHWKALFGERIHTIRYEDLIEDQARHTEELLKFCGLPWRDACLTFHETNRIARTASNFQIKQPMYKSSVNRWLPYAEELKEAADILAVDLSD